MSRQRPRSGALAGEPDHERHLVGQGGWRGREGLLDPGDEGRVVGGGAVPGDPGSHQVGGLPLLRGDVVVGVRDGGGREQRGGRVGGDAVLGRGVVAVVAGDLGPGRGAEQSDEDGEDGECGDDDEPLGSRATRAGCWWACSCGSPKVVRRIWSW